VVFSGESIVVLFLGGRQRAAKEWITSMNDQYRPPYRVPEASRRLGITDYLTRKAIRSGLLDAFRIGNTVMVRPESVDRLLRGDPGTQADDPGTQAEDAG
jgi:excisionase family DNA binding protein